MSRRLAVTLLAVALVLTACSGTGDTDGEVTTSTGPAGTVTTAPPPTTTTTTPLPTFTDAQDATAFLFAFDPVSGNAEALRLALETIPGGHFTGSPLPAFLVSARPDVAEVILDDLAIPSALNVHILVAMERFGTPLGTLESPQAWPAPTRIGISSALKTAAGGYFGPLADVATGFIRRLLDSELVLCEGACPWAGAWYDAPRWVQEVRGTATGDVFTGKVGITGVAGTTRFEDMTMELTIGRWVVTAGYLAEVDAPVFTITIPLDGVYVTDPVVALSGLAEAGTSVSVGTDSFLVDDFQFWDLVITLRPGRNEFAVTATNAAGKSTTQTITLFYVADAVTEFGYVVAADATSVTVDPAAVFFAEEADAAARADGVIGEGETISSGVYVSNPDPATVVLPIDPGVRVIVVDAGFVYTLVTYADLRGFIAGRLGTGVSWYAGNPITSPFTFLTVNGRVVQIEEQSLPRRAGTFAAAVVLAISLGVGSGTAALAAAPSSVGMVDPASGIWYLRDGSGATASFYFGDPGDAPFTGDWDCDGIDTPGLYRRSDGFVYLRNSNTQGVADVSFFFGDPGDLPVPGDFDGDGCDSVSLYRPSESRFYLTDRLGAGAAGIGTAERSLVFGNPGDVPLAADFDADGIDEIAVRRGGTFYTPGGAIGFGNPDDVAAVGDWNGNGAETVGVYRPGRARFLLRDGAAPTTDRTLPYGHPEWTPVTGRFGFDGTGDGHETLVLHAVGDVNLDTTYVPTLRRYGHDYAWGGIGDLFTADALSIVNLECAPGPGGTAAVKTFVFRCDPAGLDVMAAAGVEAANLANNHSQDHGPAAMVAGRGLVAGAGIAPVGAGADLADALRPATFDLGGTVVAVLGFGGVVPTPAWLATPQRPGMADGDDIALMTDAVSEAAKWADLVLVTIHWGIERDMTPRADDVRRGRALIDAGADAVFGHHPHRLQPLEMYRDRPIFWSLGNFVWTDHSPQGNITAVAEVIVQPDGMITAHLIPARIVDDGRPVLTD